MISNSNDDFIGKETVNLKIFKDYISSLENQKVDPKVWDPLKQRQMKYFRTIFDGDLSFEIDTFLGCLWSRNINFEFVYLDIEQPWLIFFANLAKTKLI